jgi:hypothetical protein
MSMYGIEYAEPNLLPFAKRNKKNRILYCEPGAGIIWMDSWIPWREPQYIYLISEPNTYLADDVFVSDMGIYTVAYGILLGHRILKCEQTLLQTPL